MIPFSGSNFEIEFRVWKISIMLLWALSAEEDRHYSKFGQTGTFFTSLTVSTFLLLSPDSVSRGGQTQGAFPIPSLVTFSAPASIVGKSDFASRIQLFLEYFSEFSGVFFRILLAYFMNSEYFSEFLSTKLCGDLF